MIKPLSACIPVLLSCALAVSAGEAAPQQPGLAIIVGIADANQPVTMHKSAPGRWTVHAIDADPAKVAAVRAAAGNALGRVEAMQLSAELRSAKRLPYMDHVANLVIAQPGVVEIEELRRIAQPGARIQLGDRSEIVPAISGQDEWTHVNRDASGNPASQDTTLREPNALRWINDRARGFGSYASRVGNGRFYHCFDLYDSPDPQPRSNDKSRRSSGIEIVARDARNGITLWTRTATGQARAQPLVVGDRLVMPFGNQVMILDGASGAEQARITDAGAVLDAALVDGVLVLRSAERICAYAADTLAPRWRVELPLPADAQKSISPVNFMVNQRFNLIVAGEGLVFALSAGQLIALKIADGSEAWRVPQATLGAQAYPQFISQGRVFLTSALGYVAASATNGALLWSRLDPNNGARTMLNPVSRHWMPQTFLSTGGLIWVRMDGLRKIDPKKPGPPLSDEEKKTPGKGWLGLDPASGDVKKSLAYPTTDTWLERCYPDIAVGGKMLSWAMEWFDLSDGSFKQLRSTRGVCGSGFVIGYGQVLVPPTPCLYCFPMLRGANAQGDAPRDEVLIPDDARLVKGPAFAAPWAQAPAATDWPAYRGSAQRSNASSVSVNAAALKVAWTLQLAGRSSQVVTSNGLGIASDINAGRLTAINLADGTPRWTYLAGGRIDTSPTIHNGALYFGCHDGSIQSVGLDGVLRWRFRAAPSDRQIIAFDQVESAWPVLGSVTIHEGTLYAIAGRQTRQDGGMTMWALNPADGSVVWRQQLTGNPRGVLHPKPFFQPMDHMVLNPLVPQGEVLSLHDQYTAWHFRRDTGALIAGSSTPVLWRGFDRGLQGSIVSGQEPWFHHRYIDAMEPRPVSGGEEKDYKAMNKPIPHRLLALDMSNPLTPQQQMWVFSATSGFGVNLRKLPTKKPDHMELWPASYDKPDLTPDEMPWKGVSLTLDPKAMVLAGDTVLIAGGTTFTRDHAKSQLKAFALKDGSALGSVDLDGGVSFDGMSVADGRVLLAMRDGRIICLR